MIIVGGKEKWENVWDDVVVAVEALSALEPSSKAFGDQPLQWLAIGDLSTACHKIPRHFVKLQIVLFYSCRQNKPRRGTYYLRFKRFEFPVCAQMEHRIRMQFDSGRP